MGKKKLGKGLNALFSSDIDEEKEKLKNFNVNLLQKGKFQPRKYIDEETLLELVNSIKLDGIIEPLIIRPIKYGKYEIICGERRFEAAKLAGLEEVPVIVRDVSDLKALELSLVENLQRENLDSLDEAEGYNMMSNKFHLSHQEISERVGKKRSTITNSLRLLDLPDKIKKMLRKKMLTAGHGRTILTLENENYMETAANIIIRKKMSVRETEDYVKNFRSTHSIIKKKKDRINPEILNIEKNLSEKIGKPVSIKLSGKKGKVIIEFFSVDELNSLISYLGYKIN